MTLTDRDKKIALVLVPLLIVLGYWFLILSPQRSESARLGDQLTQAEGDRDTAVSSAQSLESSKSSYASDYETVVRLGKAVPSSLDMPSLLVQLQSAAKGAGIDFASVTAGQRTAATTPASGDTSSSGGSSSSPPVAAGGEKAATGPGTATEQANDASKTSDDANKASGATTSTTGTDAASGSAVPGFDTVPLTFTFQGSYFDLADFFHRVKRFVRVANSNVDVKGRLMTIDGMSFKSEAFPKITADLTATVYLSPKSQGATAGGTPQGPTTTNSASTPPATPSTSTSTPSQSSNSSPASSSSGGSGGAQ